MSMGWAEAEREEHMEYMRQKDLEAGHKPDCLISIPPPSGGYCDCGIFERGVSIYDPLHPQNSESAIYNSPASNRTIGLLLAAGIGIVLLALIGVPFS